MSTLQGEEVLTDDFDFLTNSVEVDFEKLRNNPQMKTSYQESSNGGYENFYNHVLIDQPSNTAVHAVAYLEHSGSYRFNKIKQQNKNVNNFPVESETQKVEPPTFDMIEDLPSNLSEIKVGESVVLAHTTYWSDGGYGEGGGSGHSYAIQHFYKKQEDGSFIFDRSEPLGIDLGPTRAGNGGGAVKRGG